jgi:hypothetical protein
MLLPIDQDSSGRVRSYAWTVTLGNKLAFPRDHEGRGHRFGLLEGCVHGLLKLGRVDLPR